MVCEFCGQSLTTGGCLNPNCPGKVRLHGVEMKDQSPLLPLIDNVQVGAEVQYVTPLEDWIDAAGLREFIDQHLKIHLKMYGVSDEDMEDLVRCIMISLRQELTPRYIFKIKE